MLLMIGAVVLWVTAVWMLGNTLNISYRHLPSTLGPLLQATIQGRPSEGEYIGLTTNQMVPAGLLLILVVALPLVMWSLCEEWFTRYTVTEQGLLYQTVGPIAVLYPWDSIRGIRRVDPQSDEPVDELIVDRSGLLQIKSRLLRWLHRVAFGRARVPVYAGVEERNELLARITVYSGLQPATPGQGIETARRSL